MTEATMQSSEVYFRKGSIHVISISFTEFGVGVSVGPMFKTGTREPREVGQAVVSALDASRRGIPQPSNIGPIQKELYRFTGAKSWSDLERTSAHASADRQGATVTVTRSKQGQGGGFEPVDDGIRCPGDDLGDIGRAVLEALGLPQEP
jgi:hypothetical protein